MSMQSRIEKGMALLDKVAPDWHWRVKPRAIDIQDMEDCVLGQCFSDYNKGEEVLGIKSEWQSYQHGFLDWSGYIFPAWMWQSGWMPSFFGRKLSKEWKHAILQRRKHDQTRHVMEKLSEMEAHV